MSSLKCREIQQVIYKSRAEICWMRQLGTFDLRNLFGMVVAATCVYNLFVCQRSSLSLRIAPMLEFVTRAYKSEQCKFAIIT